MKLNAKVLAPIALLVVAIIAAVAVISNSDDKNPAETTPTSEAAAGTTTTAVASVTTTSGAAAATTGAGSATSTSAQAGAASTSTTAAATAGATTTIQHEAGVAAALALPQQALEKRNLCDAASALVRVPQEQLLTAGKLTKAEVKAYVTEWSSLRKQFAAGAPADFMKEFAPVVSLADFVFQQVVKYDYDIPTVLAKAKPAMAQKAAEIQPKINAYIAYYNRHCPSDATF